MRTQVLAPWQPAGDAAQRLLGTQLPSLQRVSRSCEDVQLLLRHTQAHRARRRAAEGDLAEESVRSEGQRRHLLGVSAGRPSLGGDDGAATAAAGSSLGGDSARRDSLGSDRRHSLGAERRQSLSRGSGRRESLAGGAAVGRDVAEAFASGMDVCADPYAGPDMG